MAAVPAEGKLFSVTLTCIGPVGHTAPCGPNRQASQTLRPVGGSSQHHRHCRHRAAPPVRAPRPSPQRRQAVALRRRHLDRGLALSFSQGGAVDRASRAASVPTVVRVVDQNIRLLFALLPHTKRSAAAAPHTCSPTTAGGLKIKL